MKAFHTAILPGTSRRYVVDLNPRNSTKGHLRYKGKKDINDSILFPFIWSALGIVLFVSSIGLCLLYIYHYK